MPYVYLTVVGVPINESALCPECYRDPVAVDLARDMAENADDYAGGGFQEVSDGFAASNDIICIFTTFHDRT